MRLGHVRRRAHCKWQTHPVRRPHFTETTACLRAHHARQNTLQRCWQSGSRFGLRCSDPARSDCSPGYLPILPVRMSGPSSCEWDGTGACTWSVAMEAHPERASITKSTASHFCQFIAFSGTPNPPSLTRTSDRLYQARVIVLDVADPGAHRPTRHLFGPVGWITR